MTKEKFIEFSCESEEVVNQMLNEFDHLKWVFNWDDLHKIIVLYPLRIKEVISILALFRENKVKITTEKNNFLYYFANRKWNDYNNEQILDEYKNNV
jgi:hypothetical protein